MPGTLLHTSVTKKGHRAVQRRELSFQVLGEVFSGVSTGATSGVGLKTSIFLKSEPELWPILELRGVQVLQLHRKKATSGLPPTPPPAPGPLHPKLEDTDISAIPLRADIWNWARALSNNRQSHYCPQTRVIGAVTEPPGTRVGTGAWRGPTYSQAALCLRFHK